MTNINKEYFFETKEDYLNFKAQWAKSAKEAKEFKDGSLQAVHHLIYNIARDKPVGYGFTPVTKKTKLENGHDPDGAFKRAKYMLELIQRSGKDSYYYGMVMKPFGDMLSLEKLMKFNGLRHR